MTIVITGGSGFIGTGLSRRLVSMGNTVVIIDVVPPNFTHEKLFFIKADITVEPLPYGILEKADAVINLVGKRIVGKWTESFKKEIEYSRIESTKHIVESIEQSTNKPKCFICASAIGFYGDTESYVVDEGVSQGTGFLAEIVARWEEVAQSASNYGVRVVCVRTAPVLSKRSGLLAQILKTNQFGFLLKLKKEDFWMSWIHEDDIVSTYIFALETSTVQGVFNASSPNPVTQDAFMKLLSKLLNRKVLGTLPKIFVRIFFREFFDEITKNKQVVPKRLIDKGFTFQYSTLEAALIQILKK